MQERLQVVEPRSLDPRRLSYRMLCPKTKHPGELELLADAYRLWTEVWHETLLELDDVTRVPSDELTRQDQIGALFHGTECIAMSAFRWVDLRQRMHRDDSYFTVWPELARDKACRNGFSVCIGSNIEVDPEFRTKG
jgi:hypothetical protein